MKQPTEKTQKILESLQRAVTTELDKKKRLGQYAVIWKNGRPVAIGEDAPASLAEDRE